MEYFHSVPVNHGTGNVLNETGVGVHFEGGTFEYIASTIAALTPVRFDSKNTTWDNDTITFDSNE